MAHSLSERVERTCKAFAQSPAFLESGDTPVSFFNFFLAISRFSECLVDAGVQAGDHVVVATRETISVVAMKLALIRIGATPIAVGIAAAAADGPVRVNWVVRARPECSGQAYEIPFDQFWIRTPGRYIPITPGGRIIHATSGTTGIPKLRNDSEETFLARINNGLRARGALDGPVFVAQNVGSLIGLKSVLSGLLEVQCVMPMMATVEETVRGLAANKIVHAFIPPLHLKRLVEAAEATGVEIPSLRRINVGGGGISAEFALRCERVFGCEVYTDYGSTETDTVASYRASRTVDSPGLVGPIWDVFNYRFQTLEGADALPSDGGELFLQVPANMRTDNYPETTALFDNEGWISTGDIGRVSPEGNLVLLGRKSELINAGGNKLAPSMLEHAAAGYSGVGEVAAFRVPTDTGIDAIGFGVVVADGYDEAEFRMSLTKTIGDLYDFRIMQVGTIPQTDTGKTDRKALSEALQDQEGPRQGTAV
jgi:long-chain acyl-CoA synthetase